MTSTFKESTSNGKTCCCPNPRYLTCVLKKKKTIILNYKWPPINIYRYNKIYYLDINIGIAVDNL